MHTGATGAQHAEHDVATAAEHGVLAVHLAQCGAKRVVAHARKAAGYHLAGASLPAMLRLPRQKLDRHPVETATPPT
eukprot:CAMPEP_0119086882 /NCGR_PEP_ID=MMETSP1178-20130426/139701_1 /TAXON_ID=33656 /ORGANISM="unid sp, Strain CCMP2000" /LENGTH=76 /DNA_ID=CAMNT_0007070043 /DNA_START=250 /DNA_END=478 /DNA_ORIENTATION=+